MDVDIRHTYRDGGTYTFVRDGKTYYVDRRIGTKTRDKVFDRYPGDPDAKMVFFDVKDDFLKKIYGY